MKLKADCPISERKIYDFIGLIQKRFRLEEESRGLVGPRNWRKRYVYSTAGTRWIRICHYDEWREQGRHDVKTGREPLIAYCRVALKPVHEVVDIEIGDVVGRKNTSACITGLNILKATDDEIASCIGWNGINRLRKKSDPAPVTSSATYYVRPTIGAATGWTFQTNTAYRAMRQIMEEAQAPPPAPPAPPTPPLTGLTAGLIDEQVDAWEDL